MESDFNERNIPEGEDLPNKGAEIAPARGACTTSGEIAEWIRESRRERDERIWKAIFPDEC
jgi:hypothetical protein